MYIDGNLLGQKRGWKKVQPILKAKLEKWGHYDLGYPGGAWASPCFRKELELLESCGAEFHAVKNEPHRINFRLSPEVALKVFRKAWFSEDYPAEDASSDEGTLYGFIGNVLTTFEIELV